MNWWGRHNWCKSHLLRRLNCCSTTAKLTSASYREPTNCQLHRALKTQWHKVQVKSVSCLQVFLSATHPALGYVTAKQLIKTLFPCFTACFSLSSGEEIRLTTFQEYLDFLQTNKRFTRKYAVVRNLQRCSKTVSWKMATFAMQPDQWRSRIRKPCGVQLPVFRTQHLRWLRSNCKA